MWYEWDSLEDFNTWHDAICITLEIPNEQILAYTKAIAVDDKVIAVVHDAEAAGLTPTELRVPPRIVEES